MTVPRSTARKAPGVATSLPSENRAGRLSGDGFEPFLLTWWTIPISLLQALHEAVSLRKTSEMAQPIPKSSASPGCRKLRKAHALRVRAHRAMRPATAASRRHPSPPLASGLCQRSGPEDARGASACHMKTGLERRLEKGVMGSCGQNSPPQAKTAWLPVDAIAAAQYIQGAGIGLGRSHSR